MSATTTPIRIPLASGQSVSGLLCTPESPSACFVFAHGAGAGMGHAFMASLANALAERGVATLRFQFPFMEEGSKRPDPPAVAQAAVRAAAAEAAQRLPGVPLFAGGKSFGGRMSSQAQAQGGIDGVRGLIFVGFPLHPSGKPATSRAEHLAQVSVPMLFLQGTRDALAELELIEQVTSGLGDRATLVVIDGADHAFHVLARSGRTDADVIAQLADECARWLAAH
ncbi:alpha/beta hydrolase family protein [Ramlibacter albus]|uniref:Alpha/beta fold hydrolase n=1 Tax=Ramlibacter albus TaxID=2079448 RepID=A0A923ME57_9BURK|nr:alpha/beta fold hydrolase [Ramlibacter albus]MBC5767833.1 alpha/beta fold hydrolase [Ramlibacter albus]